MTKNYFYQVTLIQNSYQLWCDIFAYSNFGNLASVVRYNGFLHIINPFTNKNLYYENKF